MTIPTTNKEEIDSPITMHSFAGWSTTQVVEGEDTEIVEYAPGDEIKVTENTTLYAVYTSDLIASVPNAPILGDGMKAVWWTNEDDPENSEVTADSYPEGSYSYVSVGHDVRDEAQSKWANAITVEDGSYWVWIPRYAYKIHSFSTSNGTRLYKDEIDLYENHENNKSGQIEVIFLKGTSNNEYIDEIGETKTLPAGYMVHPAFQKMTLEEEAGGMNSLGKWDAELEGIWVAKYSSSIEEFDTNENIWKSKEQVSSRYVTTPVNISNGTRFVFKPNRYMCGVKNVGLGYSCFKQINSSLNSHMLKNSEWGAIAYLSYSNYGRNGNQIAFSYNTQDITGSGKSSITSDYNVYNLPLNDLITSEYVWYKSLGVQSSSTGNMYGIYDLAGSEYNDIAAYINNGSSSFLNHEGIINDKEIKYKQVYPCNYSNGDDNRDDNYELLKTNKIIGDAFYEITHTTSYGWQGRIVSVPGETYPFITRGGSHNHTFRSADGIFHQNVSRGGGESISRAVLTIGGKRIVTYDANTSDNTVSNIPASQEKRDGFSITLSDIIPTRDGYTFCGWGDSATSTIPTYLPGDKYSKNGETTLYAIWMPDEHITYIATNTEIGTGTFINGTSENLVAYDSNNELITKYSHTANINDEGTKNGYYSNNLATKDVVSIPGASSLHVKVTYGTENNYDMLYIFQGEYIGSVTKNMSAGQLYKLMGGNNATTTVEYDIPGDTATFAFFSDSSSTYYGYYAVVTNGVKALAGSYEEPSLADTIFIGWADVNNATTPTYFSEENVVNAKSPSGTVYAVYGYAVEYDLNGYNGTKPVNSIKLKDQAIMTSWGGMRIKIKAQIM